MVSVHLKAWAGSSLEWSAGYKMLNLTRLMVSPCSRTLALTADLTAECTGRARRTTDCTPAPCSPCAGLSVHTIEERLWVRKWSWITERRVQSSNYKHAHIHLHRHSYARVCINKHLHCSYSTSSHTGIGQGTQFNQISHRHPCSGCRWLVRDYNDVNHLETEVHEQFSEDQSRRGCELF